MKAAWPIAAIGGGAALAAFALLYRFDPPLYFAILRGWGVDPFRFPFLDTHAVVSALECTRRGFDTYLDNPCDVLGRTFIYSPLILGFAAIPIRPDWLGGAGVALAALFLVAVAALPSPRGAREWLAMILAATSTMSVFAIERGNLDLLIFAAVTLAGGLARRGAAARAAGYGLVLAAGGLKYYPLAALLAMLRETPRRFVAMAAACAAVAALFLLRYHAGLAEALAHLPRLPFMSDMFGAANLLNGLAALLASPVDGAPAGPAQIWLPWLVVAIWLFLCARRIVAILGAAEDFAALDASRAVFLAMGAAMIVGCFVSQQNVGYRGIYFLLVLPGLLTLSRRPAAGRGASATVWLILFLMWSAIVPEALQRYGAAHPAAAAAARDLRFAFWFVRELIWWYVVAGLVGWLLCFAATSEMGRWAAAIGAARRVKS